MTTALANARPVAVPIAPSTDHVRMDVMGDAKPLNHWPAARATFCGVDPSLTATGIGLISKGRYKSFRLTPPKTQDRGVERLAWFRREFTSVFTVYRPAGIAIEGYSFGSRNGREALGELGSVLRLAAHDCRLPFVVLPPTSLKLFATGPWTPAKGLVIKEAFKRWGIDVSDDNEADGCVLALMAHAHHGTVEGLTAFQQKALKAKD